MMRYVAFSGGADSTALAILLHERGEEFELVFSDTGAELLETYWFVHQVARRLGKKLHVTYGGSWYMWLVHFNFFLPSSRQRWCTKQLKQVPQRAFFKDKECIVGVGIRADEAHRLDPTSFNPDYEYDRPLVEAGLDKKDVLKLCEKYDLLNPCYSWRSSCSCFCCPFQRKGDWLGLLDNHPNLYALAEEWEAESIRTSVEYGRKGWTFSGSFSLEELRKADEAQLKLWEEPQENACLICRW